MLDEKKLTRSELEKKYVALRSMYFNLGEKHKRLKKTIADLAKHCRVKDIAARKVSNDREFLRDRIIQIYGHEAYVNINSLATRDFNRLGYIDKHRLTTDKKIERLNELDKEYNQQHETR